MAITAAIPFLLITLTFAAYIETVDHILGQDVGAGLTQYRRLILSQNAKFVGNHNSDPTKTWKIQLYPMFAALTPEEVTQKFLTPNMASMIEQQEKVHFEGIKSVQIPTDTPQKNLKGITETVNLTISYGTYVKNQGQCGNCYAYATVDAINMFFRKMKINSNAQLSIQQLTDCSKNYLGAGLNNGCNGGWYLASYIYAMNVGLTTETFYPYSFNTLNYRIEQPCRSSNGPVYKIYKPSYFNDNERLSPYAAKCNSRLPYLRNGSAISVAMYASDPAFYSYKSGVIIDCKYPNTPVGVDHAVLLVGFQTSTVAIENYLILKNSWGPNWGETGHFKIFNPQVNPQQYSKCFVCNYGYFPAP